MFTKVLIPVLLIARVLATPVDTSVPSFNDLGIQSLQGFDDFYGVNNFDGSQNAQVVVVKEQQTVCQSLSARVIQQRLAILQEVAKRILTEQVCQVETQTVVLEQFQSGLTEFSKTVVRQSVQQVGFDSNIAGLLSQLVNSDGSLSTNDLGFDGSSIGKNTVVPVGNNWNDNSSPSSTGKVKDAAKKAAKSSGKNNNNKNNSSSASSSTTSSDSKSTSASSNDSSTTADATTTTASQAESTSASSSSEAAKGTSA